MQTASAFLDDLIRATWNGEVVWAAVKSEKPLRFDGSFSGRNVRAFLIYRHYQVSPGATIAEREYHVERQGWSQLFRELRAPQAWKKELWDSIGFKAWEVNASQNQFLKENGYLIRFDGGDPRGRYILYQEAGRRLKVYVEGWTADERSLKTWNDPVDKDISLDRQSEIKSRIEEWSRSLGPPVKFSPPPQLN